MKEKQNFNYKVADWIIDQRILILILFLLLSIFSAFKFQDTVVQNDLTKYLPEDSQTRVGLEVMSDNFTDTTVVSFMIRSSVKDVETLLLENEDSTILSVSDEIDDYLLYSLSFDSVDSALDGKDFIETKFNAEDFYLSSIAYNSADEYIATEMQAALFFAVLVIILVLIITSSSFAEIPILLLVFAVSALIGAGTNFIFPEISYISNSVSVILQLALAIDYALIFIHRYAQERKEHDSAKSSKYALAKAIPEVTASSFTTICGFISLSFMTYQIGHDMAVVLIKSIVISLATVFLLLPSLVVIFDKSIQKTTHRNFVPSISGIMEKSINLRKLIVPLFLILAFVSTNFSAKSEYTFNANEIVFEGDIETQKIRSIFGSTNEFVILSPVLENTSDFIEALDQENSILSINSFETYELFEGVTLLTQVNYTAVSHILALDEETALMLFGGYATSKDEIELFYENLNTYQVAIIDLIGYLELLASSGELPENIMILLAELSTNIEYLKSQFVSDEYKRIIISSSLDVESDETFEFVERLQKLTSEYFTESYIVSESLSSYELKEAFTTDRLVVNGLSALFIAIILLFTFKSFTSAIAMIFCIQTAINLNFAIPYFQNTSLFFIGYLVVVAIQMGATIDYAIVISNRYKQLLVTLAPKEAIKTAVDQSFVTILSSGSVLCLAGLILSKTSSDFVISSLGECLARGTLISILLVLFVLPSLLFMKTKKK